MKENNGYLLDTHIFIWWMEKNNRLPAHLFVLINDPQNKIILSVVSIWEIVIKNEKKKLHSLQNIKKDIETIGFDLLGVDLDHVFELENLSALHKDPFDRMLIAQAKAENLTLITADEKLWKYDIPLLQAK